MARSFPGPHQGLTSYFRLRRLECKTRAGIGTVLAAVLSAGVFGAAECVQADSLIIDSRADWQTWEFAAGTVHISEAGRVQPRFYRKDINACLDAHEFVWRDRQQREHVGGVRNVGSDPATAQHVIDGDMRTSWGPLRQDGPDSWWIEIDLARLVTATSVILRFDAEADPFEEFMVYASDGTPAFVSPSPAVADAPDYQLIGSQTRPNREYVIEYPLQDAYNPDLPHRSVRYVYLQMTAWRDPETNPRLSSLEVMALGDNIALGSLERGGNIRAYSAGGVAANLIDGDGTTFWESSRWSTFPEAHWWFHLHLGAQFWIDTIVLIAYPPSIMGQSVTPPVHHTIDVSDGIPQPGMAQGWAVKGPYEWTVVDQVSQNPPPGSDRPQYVLVSSFPPRRVGRIFYDSLTPQGVNPGRIRVREVQAYGEGYIPSATLRSPPLDLGQKASISVVDWTADTAPGTGVRIRTRTGEDIVEELRYYTVDGDEVADQRAYDRLPPFRRGEIRTVVRIGDEWSGWSRPYIQPGDRFLSPSPRRYLQLEVYLETTDPHAAASLDRISLTYSDPLAESLVGAIWPPHIEEAAVPQDFTLFILPSFEPDSRGFDEILISTPSLAELLSVSLDGVPVKPDSVYSVADSLWIRLPLVRHQIHPLIEVEFRCTVFLNGTAFDAVVGLSSAPEAHQRITAGQISTDIDSRQLYVELPVERELLEWSGPSRLVLNPDGSGLNDELVFDFNVLKLHAPRPIGVRLYTLQGSLVRHLQESGISGRYQIPWDGRDETGTLVPPGLYLAEVYADGVARKAVLNRMVRVIY